MEWRYSRNAQHSLSTGAVSQTVTLSVHFREAMGSRMNKRGWPKMRAGKIFILESSEKTWKSLLV